MKSCFFIGHADAPQDIFPGLSTAIEHEIILNGVTEFYVGNYDRFDLLVYRALRVAKRKYPHIGCYLVTAYPPDIVNITAPADFDGIFCPLNHSVPPYPALSLINHAMIDQCNVLISSVHHPERSQEALQYALRREKEGLIRIVNLMTP